MDTVAIIDPVPVYRRGLAAALREADYLVTEVADVDSWVDAAERVVAMITVRGAGELETIAKIRDRRPDSILVGLTVETGEHGFREALRAGADAAAAWDAEPERHRDVLQAALDGDCLISSEIARALAVSSQTPADTSWLSPEEVNWLRLLAQGATVVRLASSVGWSEREMHRRLYDLYYRMGASSRAEALVLASRWGIV